MFVIGFFRAETTNRAIAYSMSFSMFSRLLTFAQYLVISYYFLASETDIVFYLLSVVILLTTFVNAVNQQVIVPSVISTRASYSEEEAKKLISRIYIIYLIAGVLLTILLLISPMELFNKVSGFDKQIYENKQTIFFMLPVFLLVLTNNYIIDIFTSYRYFTVPMILDMVKNILIILFVLIFKDVLSVSSLALGYLSGYIIQFIILNIMLSNIIKLKVTFKKIKTGILKSKNIIYVIGGQLAIILNNFIIMYLISSFNEGVFSAMEYGRRINTILIAVIVVQFTTVTGVRIIELYTQKKYQDINNTFSTYLRAGLFILMPLCIIMSMNAESVVSIVFERGEFGSEAVRMTTDFFRIFVLTIPFRLIERFVFRLIIAKQIQKVGFICHLISNTVQVIVIWILVKNIGYTGYPVGLFLSLFVYVFLILIIIPKKHFDCVKPMPLIKNFFASAGVNILIAVGIYFIVSSTGTGQSFITKTIILIALSGIHIIAYAAICLLTGFNKDIILSVIRIFKSKILKINEEG